MDTSKAKIAFRKQRHSAEKRGIAWELSFEQWLAWWGNDLSSRGSKRGNLQMQRPVDRGPYALGNIVKGTQAQNMRTAGMMRLNRASERARREHQKHLDSLMWGSSKEAPDDFITDAEMERLLDAGAFCNETFNAEFLIDKDR